MVKLLALYFDSFFFERWDDRALNFFIDEPIIPIIFFNKKSIVQKELALEYFLASSIYFKEGSPLAVDFPPLPSDWVWNGYYRRVINSPVLGFFGEVAIRVSYDKTSGIHHAYIPTFIIPYLKITTYDLEFLIKSFHQSFVASEVIEKYSQINDKEYFDLSFSSLYFLIEWFIRKCRTFEIYFF